MPMTWLDFKSGGGSHLFAARGRVYLLGGYWTPVIGTTSFGVLIADPTYSGDQGGSRAEFDDTEVVTPLGLLAVKAP